jgi:hypothetical protein
MRLQDVFAVLFFRASHQPAAFCGAFTLLLILFPVFVYAVFCEFTSVNYIFSRQCLSTFFGKFPLLYEPSMIKHGDRVTEPAA